MAFLTLSLVFGGIIAAGLPVLLHMIMRGQPKKLEFPALRFIRHRFQANKRRYRLKHLILLAVRMSILILLGLALARPILKWSAGTIGSQEAPIAAVIVFDTSPRMEYLLANRTRLDEAKQTGLWLLEQFPKESQVAVLSSQRIPDSFQVDFLAAKQRMERLTVTLAGRPVMESVIEAVRLLKKSDYSRREIYILTDSTAQGWPENLEGTLQGAMAEIPDLNVYLMDIGVENTTNATVAKLDLSEQVLSSKGVLRIDLELSHTGPRESRTVELFLMDPHSQEPRKRGTETVDFPEGNSKITNLFFSLADLQEGTNQGFLKFTSHDALAGDDAYYFTVEVQPPWNILVVAPDPADQYAMFLVEALQPSLWKQMGIASFSIKTVDEKQFEQIPPQDLLDYRAILLLDPVPLSPGSWKKLSDFAATGNGVGLFLGRHAEPMTEFQLAPAKEVLGGTLKMQVRVPDGDVWLAPEQYEHPILSTFRGIPVSDLPWNALPVFRYWQVVSLTEGSDIVIPFSDGRPALFTHPVGRGRVLVMTTPISDSTQGPFWNLIPTGEAYWLFLPLAEGMVRFLIGVGEENFNFQIGQLVTLHPNVPRLPGNCIIKLPNGEGLRITPDQNRGIITFPETEQIGNYQVSAGGASAPGSDRFQSGFSVNVPPSEWNLTRLEPERLAELFGEKLHLTRDQEKIEIGMTQARVGRELFPLLILLLLIFFSMEYFFSNRFYSAGHKI